MFVIPPGWPVSHARLEKGRWHKDRNFIEAILGSPPNWTGIKIVHGTGICYNLQESVSNQMMPEIREWREGGWERKKKEMLPIMVHVPNHYYLFLELKTNAL